MKNIARIIGYVDQCDTRENGCLCRSWGGAFRDHCFILSCRDGRKCFGLTRRKCQILKLIMPF